MNIRYFAGVVAFAAMLMVGACSSDNDSITPGTPGNTEIPDNTGGPDGPDGPDNGDEGNGDSGNEGTPGLPDDGGNQTPDDGGGVDDPIDPETDVLTGTALKGVWSGSDGVIYYFYANGNLYTDDVGTYGAGTWILFETEQILKVGSDNNKVVYKEETPATITFEDGLILTELEETLPDESHFITVEDKEVVTSIGAMSSVTWVPEEV